MAGEESGQGKYNWFKKCLYTFLMSGVSIHITIYRTIIPHDDSPEARHTQILYMKRIVIVLPVSVGARKCIDTF